MENRKQTLDSQPDRGKATRLHYLDWLNVIAILGVFLFHAVHPFDHFPWEIKNAERSVAVSLFIVFLGPWGMPFFFLMSGTRSLFSLRRRTSRQYFNERVKRLFIPFIIGSVLLSPIQLYFQWHHKIENAAFAGSLLEFLQARQISFGPQVFGWAGYHLWFLGFLFAYSVIALPIFSWLGQRNGQRLITWLASLAEKRGGLLLFVLPLVIIQWLFRPFFPNEHDWADFVFTLAFFVFGYILYADQRFAPAIRRDWPIMLALATISTLFFFIAGAADLVLNWMENSNSVGFYLAWSLYSLNGWCWTLFMIYVGMRFLNFSNQWLRYGQSAIMPFFLFHQPVIIVIAYYVVQWQAGISLKLPVVVLSSFLVSLGLYELLIKRFGPAQALLGMKPRSA